MGSEGCISFISYYFSITVTKYFRERYSKGEKMYTSSLFRRFCFRITWEYHAGPVVRQGARTIGVYNLMLVGKRERHTGRGHAQDTLVKSCPCDLVSQPGPYLLVSVSSK